MSRRLGQSISKLQLLWGVHSLQWSAVSIKSGPRKEQWWTSDRVMGSQGLLMHVGSEGWSVWSDPTDELLLLKLLHVKAGSDRKMSEATVHHSLLHIWKKRDKHNIRKVVTMLCLKSDTEWQRPVVLLSHKHGVSLDHVSELACSISQNQELC